MKLLIASLILSMSVVPAIAQQQSYKGQEIALQKRGNSSYLIAILVAATVVTAIVLATDNDEPVSP